MEFSAQQTGWLALVASPIGNLEDMTFRAVRILSEADCIAAEDTRRAAKLCAHFDIHTPRTAYHAHNEHRRSAGILDRVQAGEKIAILSDAGTPVISDPGFLIVREALKRGIEPLIAPGVSALTFAVAAAGLPADTFHFAGFLAHKSGRRRSALRSMQDYGGTWFLFESPFRIGRLLQEIVEEIGPETKIALIREATKIHEECVRGMAADLVSSYTGTQVKGEFVVGLRLPKGE